MLVADGGEIKIERDREVREGDRGERDRESGPGRYRGQGEIQKRPGGDMGQGER
ncbi:hypothetical protein Hamer_G025615 [Homarus americanus]|uniref:Uncharacterized protein n=1 Tax=Homarus americanus TaxID=6706 RepID=A0A8J5MLR4_HOMAM|nr:hypothetical protein Hamer_G025615 [Homarus americanus]